MNSYFKDLTQRENSLQCAQLKGEVGLVEMK